MPPRRGPPILAADAAHRSPDRDHTCDKWQGLESRDCCTAQGGVCASSACLMMFFACLCACGRLDACFCVTPNISRKNQSMTHDIAERENNRDRDRQHQHGVRPQPQNSVLGVALVAVMSSGHLVAMTFANLCSGVVRKTRAQATPCTLSSGRRPASSRRRGLQRCQCVPRPWSRARAPRPRNYSQTCPVAKCRRVGRTCVGAALAIEMSWRTHKNSPLPLSTSVDSVPSYSLHSAFIIVAYCGVEACLQHKSGVVHDALGRPSRPKFNLRLSAFCGAKLSDTTLSDAPGSVLNSGFGGSRAVKMERTLSRRGQALEFAMPPPWNTGLHSASNARAETRLREPKLLDI